MKPKVLVIVGPTSSGKTSLAINLAKQFSGEVISADSRQVYRGIDLCSGKVTVEEMDKIPHHLLDVADPSHTYTVSDFVRDAGTAVTTITEKNKLPILAGGTFFYIDTFLGRLSAPAVPPNPILRAELETKSLNELTSILNTLDPVRSEAIDQKNPRRLIRAIEIATELGHVPKTVQTNPYDTLTIGIQVPTDTLRHNIHVRLHERLQAGMVAEVERLLASGVSHDRLEALGLESRYISRFLRGQLPYQVAIQELEIKIQQFAKRQKTWLKRDQTITWIAPEDIHTAATTIESFMKSNGHSFRNTTAPNLK
jgi:tRNA dimethylallyltransferase